jgi:hypothetical protein
LEHAVGGGFVHIVVNVAACSDLLGHWVLRIYSNGTMSEDVVRAVGGVLDLTNSDTVIIETFVLADDFIRCEKSRSESAKTCPLCNGGLCSIYAPVRSVVGFKCLDNWTWAWHCRTFLCG